MFLSLSRSPLLFPKKKKNLQLVIIPIGTRYFDDFFFFRNFTPPYSVDEIICSHLFYTRYVYVHNTRHDGCQSLRRSSDNPVLQDSDLLKFHLFLYTYIYYVAGLRHVLLYACIMCNTRTHSRFVIIIRRDVPIFFNLS